MHRITKMDEIVKNYSSIWNTGLVYYLLQNLDASIYHLSLLYANVKNIIMFSRIDQQIDQEIELH